MPHSKLSHLSQPYLCRLEQGPEIDGNVVVNLSTRDQVFVESGYLVSGEYRQKGFALAGPVISRHKEISKKPGKDLLLVEKYVERLRVSGIYEEEVIARAREAENWFKKLYQPDTDQAIKTTVCFDMDGVVFLPQTKPALFKDCSVIGPVGSAKRSAGEQKERAYQEQQARGKAYLFDNIQTAPVDVPLAELGAYECSEYKIARLLNAMHLSKDDPNRLHIVVDDRPEILTALYNFFKKYSHLYAGKLALYILDPEEGTLKACRFRLASQEQIKQGYPPYVVGNLPDDPAITSWHAFERGVPFGEAFPNSRGEGELPSPDEFDEQEELSALWLQHLNRSMVFDAKAQLGESKQAEGGEMVPDSLPENMLQGVLPQSQDPNIKKNIVTMIAAISKDLHRLAQRDATGAKIHDEVARVGRFFCLWNVELSAAHQRVRSNYQDSKVIEQHQIGKGYLPFLAAMLSRTLFSEATKEKLSAGDLLSQFLHLFPMSVETPRDQVMIEMPVTPKKQVMLEASGGRGVSRGDSDESPLSSVDDLEGSQKVNCAKDLLEWLVQYDIQASDLFEDSDHPSFPHLKKNLLPLLLRANHAMLGKQRTPTLEKISQPVGADRDAFQRHKGKVIVGFDNDLATSAMIRDIKRQVPPDLQRLYCLVPVVGGDVDGRLRYRELLEAGGFDFIEVPYHLSIPNKKLVQPPSQHVMNKTLQAMKGAPISDQLLSTLGDYPVLVEQYKILSANAKNFINPFKPAIWLAKIATRLLNSFFNVKDTTKGKKFFRTLSFIVLGESRGDAVDHKILNYWQLMLQVYAVGVDYSIVIAPPGYNADRLKKLMCFFEKSLIFSNKKVAGLIRSVDESSPDFRQAFIKGDYSDLFDNLPEEIDPSAGLLRLCNSSPLLSDGQQRLLTDVDSPMRYILMQYVELVSNMRSPYRYVTSTNAMESLLKEVLRQSRFDFDGVETARYLMAFLILALLPNKDNPISGFGVELAVSHLIEIVDGLIARSVFTKREFDQLKLLVKDCLDSADNSFFQQMLGSFHNALQSTLPLIAQYTDAKASAAIQSLGQVPIENMLGDVLAADGDIAGPERRGSHAELPPLPSPGERADPEGWRRFIVSKGANNKVVLSNIFGFANDDQGSQLFAEAFMAHPGMTALLERYTFPAASGHGRVTTLELCVQCLVDLIRIVNKNTVGRSLDKQQARTMFLMLVESGKLISMLGDAWFAGGDSHQKKASTLLVRALLTGMVTLGELDQFRKQQSADMIALHRWLETSDIKGCEEGSLFYSCCGEQWKAAGKIVLLAANQVADQNDLSFLDGKFSLWASRVLPYTLAPQIRPSVLGNFNRLWVILAGAEMLTPLQKWLTLGVDVALIVVAGFKFFLPFLLDQDMAESELAYGVQAGFFLLTLTVLLDKIIRIALGKETNNPFTVALGNTLLFGLIAAFVAMLKFEPSPTEIAAVNGSTTLIPKSGFAEYYTNLVEIADAFYFMVTLLGGSRLLFNAPGLGSVVGSMLARLITGLLDVFWRSCCAQKEVSAQWQGNAYLMMQAVLAYCASYIAFYYGGIQTFVTLGVVLGVFGRAGNSCSLMKGSLIVGMILNRSIGLLVPYGFTIRWLPTQVALKAPLVALVIIPFMDIALSVAIMYMEYSKEPDLQEYCPPAVGNSSAEDLLLEESDHSIEGYNATTGVDDYPVTNNPAEAGQPLLQDLVDNAILVRLLLILLTLIVVSSMKVMATCWRAEGDDKVTHRKILPSWKNNRDCGGCRPRRRSARLAAPQGMGGLHQTGFEPFANADFGETKQGGGVKASTYAVHEGPSGNSL
jgi:hypothetical protein